MSEQRELPEEEARVPLQNLYEPVSPPRPDKDYWDELTTIMSSYLSPVNSEKIPKPDISVINLIDEPSTSGGPSSYNLTIKQGDSPLKHADRKYNQLQSQQKLSLIKVRPHSTPNTQRDNTRSQPTTNTGTSTLGQLKTTSDQQPTTTSSASTIQSIVVATGPSQVTTAIPILQPPADATASTSVELPSRPEGYPLPCTEVKQQATTTGQLLHTTSTYLLQSPIAAPSATTSHRFQPYHSPRKAVLKSTFKKTVVQNQPGSTLQITTTCSTTPAILRPITIARKSTSTSSLSQPIYLPHSIFTYCQNCKVALSSRLDTISHC